VDRGSGGPVIACGRGLLTIIRLGLPDAGSQPAVEGSKLDAEPEDPTPSGESAARYTSLPEALVSLADLIHADRAVFTQRQRGCLGDPSGLDGVGHGAGRRPEAADDLSERGELSAEGGGEPVHEEPVRGPGGKGHAPS
jgi:hypothetical protein